MFRLTRRVFLILIPLACLVAATCGEEKGEGDPAPSVPCGTCESGTVFKNAFLAQGEDPDVLTNTMACYDAWHPDEAPDCVLTVEYIDSNECPFETEPGVDTVVEYWMDADSVEHSDRFCALPRLAAPLDCNEAAAEFPEDTAELGWYYCQDSAENYEQACDPYGPFAGIDEDGDGNTDCDEPDCAVCEACGGDGQGCATSCHFAIRLTVPAIEVALDSAVRVSCSECTGDAPDGVDCVIDSEVVGRQCTPESFALPDEELIAGANHALELSAECGGAPCLSTYHKTAGSDYLELLSYHYCSCRCADLEGNDHTTNPDLCQCPGESICEPICEHDTICPESLQGSFCMPECTAKACVDPEVCTPPASGDPWEWSCVDADVDADSDSDSDTDSDADL